MTAAGGQVGSEGYSGPTAGKEAARRHAFYMRPVSVARGMPTFIIGAIIGDRYNDIAGCLSTAKEKSNDAGRRKAFPEACVTVTGRADRDITVPRSCHQPF